MGVPVGELQYFFIIFAHNVANILPLDIFLIGMAILQAVFKRRSAE